MEEMVQNMFITGFQPWNPAGTEQSRAEEDYVSYEMTSRHSLCLFIVCILSLSVSLSLCDSQVDHVK